MIAPEQRNLLIREDIKKGVYVENLQQETVTNFDDTLNVIEKGVKFRHVGSTNMNKESSRSHSVFTLQIESKEKREDVWNFKNSFFHLIDLAGSERQKLTETFGDRLKEAGMINKSLSSLGNVINSLVEISEGKTRHVPYRDSKLTFLLKDSLGGNSKTLIIGNISPSYSCYGETLSTLRFAERAKLVKNKAIINEDTMGTISELKNEVKRLKNILKNTQENPSSSISFDMSERIKGVEGLLEQNIRIRLQSETALQQEIEDRENYINSLISALEKYEKKIASDKKNLKSREETIKKLQKGEKISENSLILDLQHEIHHLTQKTEKNLEFSKLLSENTQLKSKILSLENEQKESFTSLSSRLKESQDFTEKLQISLRKGANEREQLHILLEEYSKKIKNNSYAQELQSAKQTIIELKNSLEQEKNKVSMLEEQLSINNESQIIDESENTTRESKFSNFSSSGLASIAESERQGVFQRVLEENDKFFKNFENKDQLIRSLQEKIDELTQNNKDLFEENKQIRRCEFNNFRLEAEADKAQDELVRKDNKIEELQSEIETIMAENEFLSTQFIEFGHSISQKEKKITELTEKLSTRPNKNQIEENLKLKAEVEDFKEKLLESHENYSKLTAEYRLSVESCEQIINEVKKLQNYQVLFKDQLMITEQKLKDSESENKDLKISLESLSKDLVQLSGDNNLNQKIKLHVKMKDENNKLKEQNYQLREDLRKINEKFEVLNKKYELLVLKGNYKEFCDIESIYKEKIEALEHRILELNEMIEEINQFFNSLHYEIRGNTVSDKVFKFFEILNQEISTKQAKIEELESENLSKNTNWKVLETENLNLRQQIDLKIKKIVN